MTLKMEQMLKRRGKQGVACDSRINPAIPLPEASFGLSTMQMFM